MLTQIASGILYECGEETNGEIKLCGSSGHSFYELAFDSQFKVLALKPSGACNINSNSVVYKDPFSQYQIGKSSCLGITESGDAYSWGHGELGELGLGAGHRKVDHPTVIKSIEKVISCASGINHSLLSDQRGRLFAWGENRNNQLGLHASSTQTSDHDGDKELFEEPFSFVPRLIPMSLRHPVGQVACGDEFSVILTTDGKVWTCGANECSQLGRGKVSRNERLAVLSLPDIRFSFVAAGHAHALAATSTRVYSWGLNSLGQLGAGESVTYLAVPTLVYDAEGGDSIVRLHASLHSSAVLLASGTLLTWGDGRRHKLLQDDTCTHWRPTPVARLAGQRVCRFLFTPAGAAFCVASEIVKIFPETIPIGQDCQILLSGANLWDNGNIRVYFRKRALVEGIDNPIVSAPGQLVDGQIMCMVPSLAKCGAYSVSVSLDGSAALPQTLPVFVHPALQLGTENKPTIENRRLHTTRVLRLPVTTPDCQDHETLCRVMDSEVFVRASFFERLPDDSPVESVDTDYLPTSEVVLIGRFDGPNVIEATIDFSELHSDKCLFVQMAVSLNGRDYSAPQRCGRGGYLLTHCTRVLGFAPNCILEPTSASIDSERTLSFRLGSGSVLDVTNFPASVALSAIFSVDDPAGGSPAAPIRRPVTLAPDQSLKMRIPTIAELYATLSRALEEDGRPASLSVSVELVVETSDLSDSPSSAQPVSDTPSSTDPASAPELCELVMHSTEVLVCHEVVDSASEVISKEQSEDLAPLSDAQNAPVTDTIAENVAPTPQFDSILLQFDRSSEITLCDDCQKDFEVKSDDPSREVCEQVDLERCPECPRRSQSFPLEIGGPTLTLCAAHPISAAPLMMRRTGPTRITVSGLRAQMEGCSAVLLDDNAAVSSVVPCAERRLGDSARSAVVDPDKSTFPDDKRSHSVDFQFNSSIPEAVERVRVCLVPDGANRWPADLCPVLALFDRIGIKTALKAKPGASAQLVVSGVHPPEPSSTLPCVVRLSIQPPGENTRIETSDTVRSESVAPAELAADGASIQKIPLDWIDVLGSVGMDQAVGKNGKASAPPQVKVTFVVPQLEGLSSLAGSRNDGKPLPLALFVGISVDAGQSFDYGDKPMLNVDAK